MLVDELFQKLITFFLRPFFKSTPKEKADLKSIKEITIFWANTELGIIFSAKSVFDVIKENIPNAKINLVVKSKILNQIDSELLKRVLDFLETDTIKKYKLFNLFTSKSDLVFVPTFNSFSTMSHIFAVFAKTKIKVGVEYIDALNNHFSFLFNYKSRIEWKENTDVHITEILLNQLYPVGISCKYNLKKIGRKHWRENKRKTILLNNEPEEKYNKWSVENLLLLIIELIKNDEYYFFFVENEMEEQVKSILEKDVPFLQFINRNDYKKIVDLIPTCDLVIMCNSNLMHLAGIFDVPQISIFGLDNPFRFAPIGENKEFLIKSSNLIDEVTAEEVYKLSQKLLGKEK